MCVPLLLINNIENARQNNLKKGVFLIAISGLLSAVSFAVNRFSIDIISSIIVFFTVTQIFMTITGFILYKHQKPKQIEISPLRDPKFLRTILMSGIAQFFSFFCILVALDLGGNIAIVYTIQSLYIVIPIILSVFIFNEHINKKKIFVIAASIVAIILMK